MDQNVSQKEGRRSTIQLGYIIQRGLGVREDDLEASKWFILSSDQGNIDALYELARIKELGFLFKPDKKETVDLYYKSAIGGNMGACTKLAHMYVEGIIGVEQDIDRGLKMYTYAARQGDSHAQFTLGKIYEEGQDVQADYSKASQYYSMISATDICGFDFSLADKYLNEKLLTRDNKKSFFILKRGDSNRGSFKLQ
jgi:TPR repeat protein